MGRLIHLDEKPEFVRYPKRKSSVKNHILTALIGIDASAGG